MASTRIPIAELARLLNSADEPLYVLDEELTIVFLNRACFEWLGDAESLLGVRCHYHSQLVPEGPARIATGLCPPPQVLAGRACTAKVARSDENGRWIERRAKFFPLGVEEGGVLAVVAIVDPEDLASEETESGPDAAALLVSSQHPASEEPTLLHEQIRRFRAEAAARYRADRLIGQGPSMRLARRQVELAASVRSSVLLVGPPGSGRRHLAAAIHYGASGSPPKGPLTPLDCSLLGADLLEAISGAILHARFSEAQSAPGTFLLHRVDEVSADVQVELSGLFVHKPIEWRLIATASEPLMELARRGKFREDLAAALSTTTIELPPLVQRRDDLPLLAQLFLEDLNAAGGRQAAGFTPAALDLLDAYSWPGNLDELAEVVAEAYRNAVEREIDRNDLPERLRLAGQAAAYPRREDETIVLNEYLGRVERELIRRALARAKGNKARAARLLGMTRPRLYRRMMQLGFD